MQERLVKTYRIVGNFESQTQVCGALKYRSTLEISPVYNHLRQSTSTLVAEYRRTSIPQDSVLPHARADSIHRCFVMLGVWSVIHSVFARLSGIGGTAQSNPRQASLNAERDSSGQRISLIALVVGDQDRQLLAEIGARNQWDVFLADSCEDARAALERFKPAVVVCDRDIPGQEWRNVIEVFTASRSPACVILLSKVVDGYLWNEVLRRGGYDVLPKPLREKDLIRAVKLASFYRKSAM